MEVYPCSCTSLAGKQREATHAKQYWSVPYALYQFPRTHTVLVIVVAGL